MKRFALIFSLLLSACHLPQIHPGGTTIPKAISQLQDDIAHTGAISVTDSLSWSPEETFEFQQDVRKLECQQNRSDPTVVTLMDKIDVMLTGSYSVDGRFNIGSITSLPSVGGSANTEKSIGQDIKMPLSFIALSQLPNRILLYKLRLVKDTYFVVPLNQKRLSELVNQYWDQHDDLENKISDLESTWSPSSCIAFKNVSSSPVLFGAKLPSR